MAASVDVGVWDRLEVSDWVVLRVEQRGSSRNLWLEQPETKAAWLHKDTVIPSNGIEQGEDWSEVISTQVARLLGIPAAQTRLCRRMGRRGSLSLSIHRDGYSLNEGQVVMERANLPDYFPHLEGRPAIDPDRPGVKRPGHSLANIRTALTEVGAPDPFEGPCELTGFDVFAGYLVLDALIANSDRHEHNWAVLTPQLTTKLELLAPTYDHASSLGFNLMDDRRAACLGDRQRLEKWAQEGRATRFEHSGSPVTLVQHAVNAIRLCQPAGADWWRDQVERLTLEPVQEPLRSRAIPEMSDRASTFASELLDLNLGRLRHAVRHTA